MTLKQPEAETEEFCLCFQNEKQSGLTGQDGVGCVVWMFVGKGGGGRWVEGGSRLDTGFPF